MINLRRSPGLLVVIGASILNGCQSNGTMTFATLAEADSQTMAELKSVLAGAMNTASVDIGPGDLTKTSTISVLPPRLSPDEDRSTVTPTQFDIILRGSSCYVVRRDTGDEYELSGVSCRALDG